MYKCDVDLTAQCPAFVGGASLPEDRQVVAVESIANGEKSTAEPLIERIDLDLDEDELNDGID